MARKRSTRSKPDTAAKAYDHKDQEAVLRPDIGLQAQFKKKQPPATWRYDRSLDPQLSWDINADREHAEALIARIVEAAAKLEQATDPNQIRNLQSAIRNAAAELRRMSAPFLNWAGKAERHTFTVPTLPLFVHERLSTEAILRSIQTHKQQLDLFADANLDLAERVLRAYEHKTGWVNRLILGDSLVVMNSLLKYEGLGGQVQCIYVDPPYGVKFGSNFQPFIRKRDVKHNDDADLTREPEMVQAYRDTWELGLHSYLTYLRDRFLLSRELLHPSGSIFVQISDENLHHVRELLDEVFGAENFCVIICYRRLGTMIGAELKSSAHYLVWYARDKERMKFRKVFEEQVAGIGTGDHFTQLENTNTGETRPMTREEKLNPKLIPPGWKPFQLVSLQTHGLGTTAKFPVRYNGETFLPGPNKAWRTTETGIKALIEKRRLQKAGNTLRFKQFLADFPFTEVGSIWEIAARDPENFYAVQTPTNIVERCLLMTTDPGDLVLDPTCGSGTTAYVAEEWGRRWITIDTSRVPLALARQRLLTATFPYFELRDDKAGPAGGFVYRRRQNAKGEEIGGIVPHVTLKSIANNEPPEEEVLVDRPEVVKGVVRVTGPFVVEATIPTPVDFEGDGVEDSKAKTPEELAGHIERMLEALRRSPVLRLPGNQVVTFKNVRQPAKTLSLHAEAEILECGGSTPLSPAGDVSPAAARQVAPNQSAAESAHSKAVAFVFGPENGGVSEQLVFQAAREAYAKSYRHLYVIGFAIQDAATKLIQNCEAVLGIPATYVAATMDLQMADLLKTTRASQIFSVTGAPEIKLRKLAKKSKEGEALYQVELLGLDVFDPVTMETTHKRGEDVPVWFLDTDYNELAFCVGQAFFPRTAAWDSLKRELRGVYADSVWEHLADTTSAPFAAGKHKQIAVKVIDDRGNELLVVKKLEEAEEA